MDAQTERARIDRMYRDAERRRDYPGEFFPLRNAAEAALAAWRARYPAEATAERRQALLAEAAELRGKASDSRTYDADGWISRAEQDRRHDAYLAQAAAKTAETEAL